MRLVVLFLFFVLAATLSANTIGVAVNGTCEAGSCPPQQFPFSSSNTLSVDSTVTLADGDMYLIDGSFTGSNDSDGGSLANGYLFQVTYEGNGTAGASAADTVTVEAQYAFQTTSGSGSFFEGLLGAFGPTIARSSSASSCVNGTLGCLGPVSPPGSFDLAGTSFPLNSTGGSFIFNPAFTSNFGAGSPVGSYIVWGQTAALPTPTPEPASLALLALGLGGIFIAQRARTRRAWIGE
jgi:hypothetical protein